MYWSNPVWGLFASHLNHTWNWILMFMTPAAAAAVMMDGWIYGWYNWKVAWWRIAGLLWKEATTLFLYSRLFWEKDIPLEALLTLVTSLSIATTWSDRSSPTIWTVTLPPQAWSIFLSTPLALEKTYIKSTPLPRRFASPPIIPTPSVLRRQQQQPVLSFGDNCRNNQQSSNSLPWVLYFTAKLKVTHSRGFIASSAHLPFTRPARGLLFLLFLLVDSFYLFSR